MPTHKCAFYDDLQICTCDYIPFHRFVYCDYMPTCRYAFYNYMPSHRFSFYDYIPTYRIAPFDHMPTYRFVMIYPVKVVMTPHICTSLSFSIISALCIFPQLGLPQPINRSQSAEMFYNPGHKVSGFMMSDDVNHK
jgi:hypothetical protein